jgi:PAS domain S-box-containing protein
MPGPLTILKEDRFFRALVENSQGVIWLLDEKFCILFRSAYGQKISGWTNEEITRVPMDLIHPETVEAVKNVLTAALGHPGEVFPLEFKILHKEGWYLCLEGTVTNLLKDPAVQGIVVNLHDITARKRAEEKLIALNRLYYFLSKMNHVIVQATDVPTMYEEACRTAVEAGKFRMAWIGRVEGEHVVPVCHFGDEAEYLSKIDLFLSEGSPQSKGPGVRAIREGRYIVCNDIEAAPDMAPWREAARERSYLSSIGLPLKQGGKVVAMFGLYADRKDFFDAEEIALLESLAADLSFALRLFGQKALRMKMEEALNRINDGVISVDKAWRYTYLNDAALPLHPGGREGVLGRSLWDVHPHLRGTIFQDKYQEAMEQRKVVEFEVYHDTVRTWYSVRAYPSEDGLTIYYKDITEQKNAQLQQAQVTEQLRKLAAYLQDIREEERSEIARDIHDDLGQLLTAVNISLYRLSKQVVGDAAAEDTIRGIIELIGKGIDWIRRISTQLRPEILHDLGLAEAMKWQIEEFEKRCGIAVKATFTGAPGQVEPKIAINLFRMFQETLTNIARHSGATQVEVRFEADGKRISLEVADNGKGLNTEEIKTRRTLGILGMKERALMIGGEFGIEGQPGKGTTVRIKVPIHLITDTYANINS